MGMVHAYFTQSEMVSLRDALSTETVAMRKHVAKMQEAIAEGEETGLVTVVEDNTIGARKHLRDLENLLAWAKEKCTQSHLRG